MPKFAPVAPIQVLEGLYSAGQEVFGDYHLLLAHHTVAHKQRFVDLFKRAADDGWAGTIIMDNSIVELGNAVDFDMIAEATNAVSWGAETTVYPVLPDVMGDGMETRNQVDEAYPAWELDMPGNGFMVVCQGEDYHDFLASLEHFGNKEAFPDIKVLGVPRVLHKTVGSRVRPALSARNYLDSHIIHLLGFSDQITDDIDSARSLVECGIDSAVPLRHRDVFNEFIDAGVRPADWFETAVVDPRMIENLQLARQMFA